MMTSADEAAMGIGRVHKHLRIPFTWTPECHWHLLDNGDVRRSMEVLQDPGRGGRFVEVAHCRLGKECDYFNEIHLY
jgi:hypothetical protein